MSAAPAVVLDGLCFSWPDGAVVFDHLNAAFPAGHVGVIGANGSGKSTLLRLIAGELTPTAGTIAVVGRVCRLAQRASDSSVTVAGLLGLAEPLGALRRIEAGSSDPADFDAVEGNWDVQERALAELAAAGLPCEPDVLDRSAQALSGGEAVAVGLIGARRSGAEITLLDEPTNNLDARARDALIDQIGRWAGVLLIASHDRALLERVDAIVDLDRHGARFFGGPFSEYDAYRRARQQAAQTAVQAADQALAVAKRAQQRSVAAQAQRDRVGRQAVADKRYLPAVAHQLRGQAEQTAARTSDMHARRVADAAEARAQAREAARQDDPIRVPLPGTTVPAGKDVVALSLRGQPLLVRGAERIRLTGDNGVGKSTLLSLLLGHPVPHAEAVLPGLRVEMAPSVPVGYLAQRDDLIGTNALDAVRAVAPGRGPQQARALLASLRLTGDQPLREVDTLSGGERFRVRLARVLFADPAPQLLVLDEPTNDLDMASVDQLVDALGDFRGALLVVTHDERLASGLDLHRIWAMSREGGRVTLLDLNL